MSEVEYEVEIKIRRNGRLIHRENHLGDDIKSPLYGATTEAERWADDRRSGRD